MEGTNSQRIKVKMTSSEDLSLLGFQIRLNTADESGEGCSWDRLAILRSFFIKHHFESLVIGRIQVAKSFRKLEKAQFQKLYSTSLGYRDMFLVR